MIRAVVAVAVVLALSAATGTEIEAQETVTVGVDVDSAGNEADSLGEIQDCRTVEPGDTFEIDIFVKGTPALSSEGGGIAGYGFDILFDPTVIQLGSDDDGDNAARTSDGIDNDKDGLTDEGGEGYDEDPPETVAPFSVDNDADTSIDEDRISHTHIKLPRAIDFSVSPQQNDPARAGGGGGYRVDGGAFSDFSSGEGALIRIPVKAVGSGISNLILSDIIGGDGVPDIFDAGGAATYQVTVQNAAIGVGQTCTVPPPASPAPPSDQDADSDGDGLSDAEEQQLGSDPNNPDSDDDGLSDAEEQQLGTDPNNPDSDDDGLSDGQEVNVLGTDPLAADLPDSGGAPPGGILVTPSGDATGEESGAADGDSGGLGTGAWIAIGLGSAAVLLAAGLGGWLRWRRMRSQ